MTEQRVLEAIDRLALVLVAITARALSEAAGDLELTLAQWRVLVVVGGQRTPPRVGDLSMRISASLPSTSRIVRRLERRGLLHAERDERDRRASLIRLTPAGTRVRRRVIQARQRLVSAALAGQRIPVSAAAGLDRIVAALEPIA